MKHLNFAKLLLSILVVIALIVPYLGQNVDYSRAYGQEAEIGQEYQEILRQIQRNVQYLNIIKHQFPCDREYFDRISQELRRQISQLERMIRDRNRGELPANAPETAELRRLESRLTEWTLYVNHAATQCGDEEVNHIADNLNAQEIEDNRRRQEQDMLQNIDFPRLRWSTKAEEAIRECNMQKFFQAMRELENVRERLDRMRNQIAQLGYKYGQHDLFDTIDRMYSDLVYQMSELRRRWDQRECNQPDHRHGMVIPPSGEESEGEKAAFTRLETQYTYKDKDETPERTSLETVEVYQDPKTGNMISKAAFLQAPQLYSGYLLTRKPVHEVPRHLVDETERTAPNNQPVESQVSHPMGRQHRGRLDTTTLAKPDPGCEEAISRYKENLYAMMNQSWRSPKPESKGIYTTVLDYTIHPNGGIEGIRISQSSGHAMIDQSARNQVQTFQGRLPALPGCYGNRTLDIHHTFRLIYR